MCHDRIQDKANPDDAEWVFELLDRIFEEKGSSAGETKENGIFLADAGQKKDRDFEMVFDLLEKILEEKISSTKEVTENEMSQAGSG
jgi:hypothetical protein